MKQERAVVRPNTTQQTARANPPVQCCTDVHNAPPHRDEDWLTNAVRVPRWPEQHPKGVKTQWDERNCEGNASLNVAAGAHASSIDIVGNALRVEVSRVTHTGNTGW
mmetsp:Transcript_58970/g.95309  ORF Transcript_58970/g.95309 Transcript_58970/m.95309 type:complete len:107 (-) Transcript_58970:1056-1376(-)